jgi:hypothetical protein
VKVLDLQCDFGHRFEGWFSSEQDFISQKESGALTCPLCGETRISKRLSAPRLNLGAPQPEVQPNSQQPRVNDCDASVQNAWVEMGRRLIANTDDVGSQFAEEARRIHYGEAPKRGIRGQATLDETHSLIDEGVPVLPLSIPDSLKQPLH